MNDRSATTTALRCICGAEWEQLLTDGLVAPRCPTCGHVGNREVSLRYPAGVLADERSAATTESRRVWYPTRLLRPYRPLRDWATWRVAEIISPLSFRGRRVTQRRIRGG